MAEKIVSPGVFTRENDLSFLPQGVAAIGAAIIGPFNEGPTTPTVVTSLADLETLYGRVDDTYYTPLTVQNYLREAGAVTVARVCGLDGYTEQNPLLLTVYNSGSTIVSASLGVLFNTDTQTASFAAANFSATLTSSTNYAFNIPSGGLDGAPISASLYYSAPNTIATVFGTNPKGAKEAYSYAYFSQASENLNWSVSAVSGSTISGSVLGDQLFTHDATEARTPVIQSQLISGQRTNILQFVTLGAGEPTNTKVKVQISSIKPAGIVQGSDYGLFTVTVRAFDDLNKRKVSVETYSGLTLDPASPNYVLRVIGNRSYTIDTDGKVTEYGDYPNVSKYIRCWNENDSAWVSAEEIPVSAVPFGHAPYKLFVSASTFDTLIPAVTYVAATSTIAGGIDLDNNTDNKIYMKPIPVGATTGSNVAFGLDASNGGNLQLTGSVASDVAKRQFVVAFQEGFNGQNPTTVINKGVDITAANAQGFDLSTTTSTGYTAYMTQINALSNADQYDMNLVVAPGLIRDVHPTLVDNLLEMVENRGDAFYIMDGTGYDGTISDVTAQAQAVDTNYAAIYYPWVKAVNTNTNKLMAVPPSVLLPAVYAANDRITAEWYAPAGLNRGGLSGAVAVLNRLTQSDRDTLYEAKVNPIAQFPGQGIVAFGQKTLQDKSSALDRINVRRLLLTVRKYIASASRYLVFEQNTSETRQRFLNIVNPYLEGIQQRQGLYSFRVQMDEALNTPDMIDRNILKGAIFLQPTKTAEFIIIDFNILPTGATFEG
jgi:phage tail sheath protein FI